MNFKHGHAKQGQVSRLHNIWRGMKKRCKPGQEGYATKRYAQRGVRLCEEWREFEPFRTWAEANGYANNLTIERNDVNGDYSPDNCSWIEFRFQSRNRTTTRWIEIDGTRKCLAAWLEETGVTKSAFSGRESRGWSESRALGLSS